MCRLSTTFHHRLICLQNGRERGSLITCENTVICKTILTSQSTPSLESQFASERKSRARSYVPLFSRRLTAVIRCAIFARPRFTRWRTSEAQAKHYSVACVPTLQGSNNLLQNKTSDQRHSCFDLFHLAYRYVLTQFISLLVPLAEPRSFYKITVFVVAFLT